MKKKMGALFYIEKLFIKDCFHFNIGVQSQVTISPYQIVKNIAEKREREKAEIKFPSI